MITMINLCNHLIVKAWGQFFWTFYLEELSFLSSRLHRWLLSFLRIVNEIRKCIIFLQDNIKNSAGANPALFVHAIIFLHQ
jgi:hypothetical protein